MHSLFHYVKKKKHKKTEKEICKNVNSNISGEIT